METLTRILDRHLTRSPQMEGRDVYKLLHQAALGAEHAVRDEQAARDRLEVEMRSMGEAPLETSPDPISPDGEIVRIHLRTYLLEQKDPELLLRAFMRTANEWHGSVEQLQEYCQEAAGWAEANPDWQAGKGMGSFFTVMEAQGFPAGRHSETYRSLYRPAYRVVARRYLEEA